MVNSRKHRKFDNWHDEDLIKKIIDKHSCFSQEHYNFAKRLNLKLVEANYNNAEFAEITGLSEPTISNYVNGDRIPKTKELQIMANKLGVSTDYLLGNTDCITFSAQEINKIIGLSENAMKILAMLNHNIVEIQDLMDPMEVSTVNKNKLDIFSALIADWPNFSTLITCLEGYVITKQKIKETNNNEEKENLEYDLIRN